MQRSDKFWKFATHLSWLVAAVFSLWITSTSFDSTEFKAILIMILGGLGPDAIRKLITRTEESTP